MTQQQSFNPNEHMMKIGYKDKAKDYLPVQWRLVWFRDLCPQGTIDTEELEYDLDREVSSEESVWNNEKKRMEKVVKVAKGYARYRAVVTDGKGGRATGTKSENAASFPDFGEKAETGAIGRALAALGYGTQFTGDEFNESHRIVDSPVEPEVRSTSQAHQADKSSSPSTKITPAAAPKPTPLPVANDTQPATAQQKDAIRKMSSTLQQGVPEDIDVMTFGSAKACIAVLSEDLKNLRKAS